MKDMKGTCCSCEKYVRLNIIHKIKYRQGGDRGFHCTEAYCSLCGDEIFVTEIADLNMKAWAKMEEGSEFYDRLGGYHSEGEGWDPNGDYCGECGKASCADCYAWDNNKKINKNKNA